MKSLKNSKNFKKNKLHSKKTKKVKKGKQTMRGGHSVPGSGPRGPRGRSGRIDDGIPLSSQQRKILSEAVSVVSEVPNLTRAIPTGLTALIHFKQ
jgi:hypothetical protein